MCNGALIGFDRDGPAYERVLVPWWECALDAACISPVYGEGRGSIATRGNHRQDQAGLTMLAHFANMSCEGDARAAGFTLHSDKVNDNTLCKKLKSSAGLSGDVIPEHDRNPLRRWHKSHNAATFMVYSTGTVTWLVTTVAASAATVPARQQRLGQFLRIELGTIAEEHPAK
jgi:hypothetical protein